MTKNNLKSDSNSFIDYWSNKVNNFSEDEFLSLINEDKTLMNRIQLFKDYFGKKGEERWSEIIKEFKAAFPGSEVPKFLESKRGFLLDKKKLSDIKAKVEFLLYDCTSELYRGFMDVENNEKRFEIIESVMSIINFFEVDNLKSKSDKSITFESFSQLDELSQAILLIKLKDGIVNKPYFNFLKKIYNELFPRDLSFTISLSINRETNEFCLFDQNSYKETGKINPKVAELKLNLIQLYNKLPDVFETIVEKPAFLNDNYLFLGIKNKLNEWLERINKTLKAKANDLNLNVFILNMGTHGVPISVFSDEVLRKLLINCNFYSLEVLSRYASDSEIDKVISIISDIVKG